jgi:hypothetical protein
MENIIKDTCNEFNLYYKVMGHDAINRDFRLIYGGGKG